MFLKKKYFIFLAVLLVAMMSVAVAADVNDSTDESVTTPAVTHTTDNTDVQTTVLTENEITKKAETNTKASVLDEPKTINVTSDNYTTVFGPSGLGSIVNDGDVIDVQSDITTNNFNITIDKAINLTTTTGATINLNTTGGNLFGTNPGNSFKIVNSGSYTNVTNLKFFNTQVFVINAHHVTMDNINVTVNNQVVGSGVGVTSIRDNSTYVTVKNSNFYTKNNGGSSSVVLAWADYCTIDNNNITGEGNVGNLMYLTTYNINGTPEYAVDINMYNNITNNNITAINVTGPCVGVVVTGHDNKFENNKVNVSSSFAGQWMSPTLNATGDHDDRWEGNSYINNKVYGSFTGTKNSTITDNKFNKTVTLPERCIFKNNNAENSTVTVKGKYCDLCGNTINTLVVSAYPVYVCRDNIFTNYPTDPNITWYIHGSRSNNLNKNYLRSVKTSSATDGIEYTEVDIDDEETFLKYFRYQEQGGVWLPTATLITGNTMYKLGYFPEKGKQLFFNTFMLQQHYDKHFSIVGKDGFTLNNIQINIQGMHCSISNINLIYNLGEEDQITPLIYCQDGGMAGDYIEFDNLNITVNCEIGTCDNIFDATQARISNVTFQNSIINAKVPASSFKVIEIRAPNTKILNNTINIEETDNTGNNPSIVAISGLLDTTLGYQSNNTICTDNTITMDGKSTLTAIKLEGNTNTITNNNITVTTTGTANGVELTGNNSTVTDNYIVANDKKGDNAVTATGENNVVENNVPNIVVHVVNQSTVEEVFSGDGHTLGDNINEGDTLDFQGLIDKEHSIVINKPVTVISSTEDAVISLHTVAGSLMGEDPGNSFVINKGASGSFISGLYLNNTECWVHNLYNSTLYNMTMHVQDARVGSGVGQTSLRYCNNVTMDSCYIYTENNGGSSSFVWTGCNNCTIINSTVEGAGNVGNLLYVGNGFNTQDMPAGYVMTNFDNNVINCTVIGGSGGICNPLQNGATRTLIKGNKFYSGGSASAGTNGTMIDNEFYRTVSVAMTANCIAHGNVHHGTGSTTIQANAQVYNNTFNAATISGANVLFENNTVKGKLTVNQPTNVKENTLADVQVGTNGKNSNITGNNVTGTITSGAANVTVDSNNIDTTNDYTVVVTGATNKVTNNVLYTSVKAGDDTLNVKDDTLVENNTPESGKTFEITDENYAQFFDTNGNLINVNVTNYSTLTFKGAFNDKVFKFDNIILSIVGDEAVINNGFISTDNDAKILVEKVTFNNTREAIPNSILLNTDGNIVRNVNIYRTSTSGISREIMVNGDKNIIVSNTFDLAVPVENIDFSDYPFAISNVSAITVTGSNNNISSNVINVTNTTTAIGAGTINVIDLASRTKSSGNTVNSNTINAVSSGYLYGINLGANTDTNTINSNNIKLTSDSYTAGIQIGYSPANDNTINSNTITLTSPIAYGVLASAYDGEVTGTTINSNRININANQAAGIELCGSTPETIKDATLTSNTIVVDGNYSIGIAIAGSDIKLTTNNITVTGTTNATDETSYDIIKPTTAGLILQNSENIEAYNNTIIAENGANIILNGTSDSKVISTITASNRFINAENNANIVLANSDNNIIDTQKAYTNNEYSVVLINSSNNRITNNNLNASNIKGGDDAVSMDEDSQNNILENNIPVFGLLTEDTYSTYFDENSVYKFPEGVSILTLAGDLYNKDLIFTNNVTFVNADKYTIYNGTIILKDVEDANYTDRFVTFRNININNTDKAAFIDNLSVYKQRNIQFFGGEFTITGDDIVAFDSVHENATYSILDVYDAIITMDGTNVTAFRMIRDSYSRYDYLDVERSNITLKASDENTAFKVINTNLDILTNNIVQEGKNVQTLYATDVYANGQFFMNNNINVTGDNVALITLKDNHGSNPTFGNNTILVTSTSPVSVMNISNATNVYVGQGQYTSSSYNKPNTIIVNADNGELPLIYIDDKGYVRNNFIMSNDLYGVEAVSAATVSNITPIRTNIEFTIPEQVKVSDEVTIIVTAVNATSTSGTLVLSINGEEVTRVDGNTLNYTITPTTNETITVSAEFINKTNSYIPSNNETVITVGKLNTSLTLEVNRPFLDEDLIISGLLTNDKGVMAGTELNLTINGNTVAVTTDSEGKYNYTTTPIEGNNTVSVSFDGGNSYYSSEESTTTFVVDLEKYALVDELNDTVNEQAGIISDLNDTVQAQDKAIEELEQNLTDANSKIDSLNNNITKLNGQVSDLTNENKQLKDNLTKANDKIATQDKTISDLNKSLADANKALADADKQIKDLNSTIAKLNDQIKNLTTPLDTKVTINSITAVKYSDDVKITGKLTDKAGNAIKNTAVTLNINGKATNVATDAKGVYTYTGKATKVGTNNVTVQYIANDKYNAAKATSTFKVNKQDLKITINNITSDAYKEDVTITGVFTDATGKGISNTNINLTINGKTVKVKTTTGGVFTYTTKATKVGTNNVTVSYAGNANYNKVTQKSTFKVVKQDLIVTIDTLDDTRFKENITISGRFVDGNAKPIGNTRLVLSINGKNYAVVTNAQGVYKRSIRVTQIDTNNVTVTYKGNANYNKCTAKATFKAIKQNLDITLDSVKTANGKVTVTGTFRDEEGKPLMNSNVKVTINGKTYSAKTNNKGIYTLTKAYSGSKITLTLGYPGNKNYNAFNKTTVLTL